MNSNLEREAAAILEDASLWCVRLAGGDMSAEDQASFDGWLERSPEHRRAFSDALKAWRRCDEAGLQPDILAFRSEALKSLASANRKRWTRRMVLGRPVLAVAAMLLMLLAGYGAYVHFAFVDYTTATGERRLVVLSDGSRLSLDADTRIGVRYRGDRRELRLARGRAKFDVAKDTLRPFTVTVGDRIVVATGTEFSVELLSRNIHVILYEGSVNVVPTPAPGPDGAGDDRRAETTLTPGKELVAGIASDQAELAPSDLSGTLSWEAGFLTFADEPLQSAVERMNRYSQHKLAVHDAGVGELLVNGVYAANDSEAFVAGVTGVLPVRVETREGIRTFLRRP